MIDPQRGNKHTCQNADCLKPFYDLEKISFACPNCDAPFDADADKITAPVGNSKGFGRGYRRKAPHFRIVSPEMAEQLASETALTVSGEMQESADDSKRLLDVGDE